MMLPDPDPELAGLVARTRGAQVWRRVFHAANGLGIAAVLTWWRPSESWAVPILIGVCLWLLAFDVVRLTIPAVNVLFFRLFTALVSPREARGLASSTWYMVGVAVVVALFPWPEAVSGILVLALADPAASYVGRRWGRRAFLGGSVEGTGAFLLTALAVLALRHGWVAGTAAALVAALAERRSWPLDDNLAVPVATAATLTLVGALP